MYQTRQESGQDKLLRGAGVALTITCFTHHRAHDCTKAKECGGRVAKFLFPKTVRSTIKKASNRILCQLFRLLLGVIFLLSITYQTTPPYYSSA